MEDLDNNVNRIADSLEDIQKSLKSLLELYERGL
jgi:hypothetical protein